MLVRDIADYVYLWFPGNCQLNRFNLISYNKKHQTRCHQLVHQAAVLTSDFIGGLTNFLSCCEQRSSIYPRDGVSDEISCVNKKVWMYFIGCLCNSLVVEFFYCLFYFLDGHV